MSSQTQSPYPAVDPYEYLQIILNPDGSITRNPNRFPNTAATPDPDEPIPVLSKDIPINRSTGTWARLFLPRKALHSSSKLPLLVYFHGGGFIHCSAASTIFHHFCSDIAAGLNVIIASVDYRLTPEHRLPAAYNDAMDSLHSIQAAEEVWLTELADLFNCFIMGSSAGANIAYHAGLRAAAEVESLGGLRIRGLILHQPFFGGTQRTASELRLVNDPVLKPGVSDLFWSLSLPMGADRDHEYCNATVGGGSGLLEKVRMLGWRVLVAGREGDPLVDRQIELGKTMEEKGVKVVWDIRAGGYHGAEINEPTMGKALHEVLKLFLVS